MKKLLLILILFLLAVYGFSIMVLGQTKEETTEDIFEALEWGIHRLKEWLLNQNESSLNLNDPIDPAA